MSSLLKDILKDYDIRRRKAIEDSEEFKKKLFSSHPRLSEIEQELNSTSINTLKSILMEPASHNTFFNNLNDKIKTLKAEKINILNSLGLDEHSLEPNFKCKLCNDTGYVNQTTMCTCLKQELLNIAYNKSSLNNLKKENFDNFDFSKYSDKIDLVKYKVNISPRDNIKNILEIVHNFINNFNDFETKNLLFTGNTGLGKTFISNCIANEILKRNKTVLYQTAPIMLDSIIDYRFNKNDGSIYNDVLTSDLLIIDDLGTETINSMKYTELFTIINSRLLSHNTKTIISTNLDANELFNRYDERLVSRFAGYYNICRFFGDDIRLEQKGHNLCFIKF